MKMKEGEGGEERRKKSMRNIIEADAWQRFKEILETGTSALICTVYSTSQPCEYNQLLPGRQRKSFFCISL